MLQSRVKAFVPYLVTLVVALVMLAAGLGRFGIWQPAELRVAEAAREVNQEAGEVPGVTRDAPSRESDQARNEVQNHAPLQISLVRFGFARFGGSEEGGRLPSALLAVLATLALAAAVGRASDARAGALVGVAYATLPLVFLNARQMFGGGVAQSGFTLLFAALVDAIWGRLPYQSVLAEGPGRERAGSVGSALRWVLVPVAAYVAIQAGGWMLAVVPALLGVGVAVMLRWRNEGRAARVAGVLALALGAVAAILCARAAVAPPAGYSALTGVGPGARAPSTLPTYDAIIEMLGHGSFPWTGILAFGLVRLLLPPPTAGVRVGSEGLVVDDRDAWRESGVRLAAFGAVCLAYGLQSFHLQQFGPSPFVAAAPLAVAIGLALRDAEREAKPWGVVTAGVLFFTLIMMRDYMLFPKSSYAALGLQDGGPSFPTGFTGNLRDWFKAQDGHALAAIFRGNAPGEVYFFLETIPMILLGLSVLFQGAGTIRRFAWDAPFAWMAEVERAAIGAYLEENERKGIKLSPGIWRLRGRPMLVAMANLRGAVAALAVGVTLIFGLEAAFNKALTTPLRTGAMAIAALPLVALAGTYVIIVLWNAFAWVGQPSRPFARLLGTRLFFLPLAGFLTGLIITQLFVPALSEHLSPRGVWAVIRQVRRNNEPVARFGAGGDDRTARYYAPFAVRDVSNEADAVNWLREREPRHFLIVGADVFPSLNRAYRRSFSEGARENVPVIDATNSNLYVAASTPGATGSRNPLDNVVRSADWLDRDQNDHWHPHGRYENGALVREPARFDDAIEYLGYNLDSGGRSYVPVGDSFKITYHFHVLREQASNHQIFVHVDGQCPRVNGDHEPAGGRYPLRYWLAGDYVHDEQRITIPGYCRAGRYYVYIGFFQGDDRMRVTGGDHDRENRVVAAVINVR